MKESSYYTEMASKFTAELNKGKKKKRKATTLSDANKDKLFTMMLNALDEEERFMVLLHCAKRGYIAYR